MADEQNASTYAVQWRRLKAAERAAKDALEVWHGAVRVEYDTRNIAADKQAVHAYETKEMGKLLEASETKAEGQP